MFNGSQQIRREQQGHEEPCGGAVAALRLTGQVTEIIRARAFEGLKALPRRGAEVGGLITSVETSEVIGTGIRLVACEYLSGPSYILSTSDVSRLRETVRQCESEGQRVIAYFRSCTRPSTQVELQDEAAIAAACPNVQFVVIAKPSLNGSVRIWSFKKESGGGWGGAAELEMGITPLAVASAPAPPPPHSTNGYDRDSREQRRRHEEPVPNRPELSLTREVLEGIRARSFAAFKVLPGPGAEIGGLITSGKSSPSIGARIHAVTSEHSFGPALVLSGRDVSRLRETVRQCESEGQAVVAYFRSCIRPSMKVEPEDEATIAQACPHVLFIVLAKPSLSGSARICWFNRETDGAWRSGAELDVAPPLQDVGFSPEAVERPDPRVRKGSRRSWILYAAALLITVSSVTAFRVTKHPGISAGPTPRPPVVAIAPITAAGSDRSLGLSAREEAGMLHVAWNRDSTAAQSAVSGVLEIADSTKSRSIPLLKADIDGGSIIYKPHSGDVTFRLQLINSAGKPSQEMVRILEDGPIADTAAPPTEQHAVKLSALARRRPTPSPVWNVAAQGYQIPAVAHFQNERPERVAPAETPRPPTQATVLSNDARTELASSGLATAPAPAQPSTSGFAAETPAPIAKPASTAQIPTAPPIATTSPQVAMLPPPQDIVPPQPLRQVSPVFDNGGIARSLIHKPVTVAVVVSVDEQGRVRNARAEGESSFLSNLSVIAARQWTFKPATLGGRPVAGGFRIEFVFRPPS